MGEASVHKNLVHTVKGYCPGMGVNPSSARGGTDPPAVSLHCCIAAVDLARAERTRGVVLGEGLLLLLGPKTVSDLVCSDGGQWLSLTVAQRRRLLAAKDLDVLAALLSTVRRSVQVSTEHCPLNIACPLCGRLALVILNEPVDGEHK